MRQLRRWHTLLGVFFAPLLFFFVGSGWYQMVDRDRLKDPGEAETLVQKLRVVHTDQVYPKTGALRQPSPKAFRILTVAMSVAILATTLMGIVLAFRAFRPRWLFWLMLAGGVLVPVVLLWLAPRSTSGPGLMP
jgi:hypothetical protein